MSKTTRFTSVLRARDGHIGAVTLFAVGAPTETAVEDAFEWSDAVDVVATVEDPNGGFVSEVVVLDTADLAWAAAQIARAGSDSATRGRNDECRSRFGHRASGSHRRGRGRVRPGRHARTEIKAPTTGASSGYPRAGVHPSRGITWYTTPVATPRAICRALYDSTCVERALAGDPDVGPGGHAGIPEATRLGHKQAMGELGACPSLRQSSSSRRSTCCTSSGSKARWGTRRVSFFFDTCCSGVTRRDGWARTSRKGLHVGNSKELRRFHKMSSVHYERSSLPAKVLADLCRRDGKLRGRGSKGSRSKRALKEGVVRYKPVMTLRRTFFDEERMAGRL